MNLIPASLATRLRLTWLLLALCSVQPTGVSAGPLAPTNGPTSSVVSTDQVRAELVALAPDGIQVGKSFGLGLLLQHQPHWHTYWKNPGDSGLPTTLVWSLPPGLVAGAIQWPIPKKIPIGNMLNYGYEGSVLLPVEVTVTPDFRPSPSASAIEVRLKASWLVCSKECIPQDGDFVLRLPVNAATAIQATAFDQALHSQPRQLGDRGKAQASWQGDRLQWSVSGLPPDWRGKNLDALAEQADVLDAGATVQQVWKGSTWVGSLKPAQVLTRTPDALSLLLVLDSQAVHTQARIIPPLKSATASSSASASASAPAGRPADTQPPLTAAPAPSTPSAVTSVRPAVAPDSVGLTGFWAALAGALLGGALLNLMPCVFPVLAIKVLSLARHGSDVRGHRVAGLAYGLGVIVSFIALGVLLLGLRAGGERLGWGFQLQDPWVVAALAALFTVVGLNLAGGFEFGQILPVRLASMEAKHPVVNALLTGVLAVAVASPCTAPFMGAALGLALSYPTLQALAIFATIGLGMAAPYVAASLVPAVARWLPRPGAWMDMFRRFLAYPMFATVVWLVWVLGQQSGIDGAAALLACLVGLGATLWALGLSGRMGSVLLGLCLALWALTVFSFGPRIGQVSAPLAAAAAPGERWQAWSAGKVEQLLASGQPVFVDFTAAWCVTCQYNKKTTLSDASLLADMDAKKVQTLRADWTRRDPLITAALSDLGRSGVPVYVLYRPHRGPILLSELISPQDVRAALAAD